MYRVKITFDEKKKDAEMIFNIQWKNKTVCVDARSNMVGMLDGSATNDYHTFKSYLLNNSGTFVNNVDNVRVSYIIGDNECYIEDDFDYNYALSFFREKALAGQYIDLKLDYVDRSRVKDKEIPPPDWFLKYMKKFKEEIVGEVTAVVMSKQHQNNSHPVRKLKPESYKRARKAPLLIGDTNDRELLTKVRTKLEKLEHKATKIKTKKSLMGLSSDSDAGKSSKSETNQPQSAENDVEMSAALIAPNKKANVAYLSGGETYVHTWDVKNNGSLPWNSSTILKYAWGSQAFEPWEKDITCPFLKPGETGCISAIFNVPALPGMYECYWHFYNNGKRFGISLSSVVMVVDNPVRAENYIRSPTYDVINIQDNYELVLPTSWTTPPQKRNPQPQNPRNEIKCEVEKIQKTAASSPIIETKDETDYVNVNQISTIEKENCNEFQGEGGGVENNDGSKVNEQPLGKENNIQIEEKIDFDLFLDESDDQSIISISDSNSSCNSKDDFVLLDSNSPTLKVDNMLENSPNNINELLVDAIQDTANGISDIKLEQKNQSIIKNEDEIEKEEVESVDKMDNQTNTVSDFESATKIVLEDSQKNEGNCNDDDKNNVEDGVKIVNTLTGTSKSCKGVHKRYLYADCRKTARIILEDSQKYEGKCKDDKNNVDSTVKIVNFPVEPSKSSKDVYNEFGYILYEGKIVRIPKRYLYEDPLKTEGTVSKAVTLNDNNIKVNTVFNPESASDLKTKDNGTIPKCIKRIKIVKKTKLPESKVQGTMKKRSELHELSVSSEVLKDIRKTKKIPTTGTTIALCERRRRQKDKESVRVKQRFFVFPQQGSGYEMVEHSRKVNGAKVGDYRLKTRYDESSGIINMYIIYHKDNKEPGVYGYFVPLEYIQDRSPKKSSSSIRDDDLIYYAVPVDVEALFNTKISFEEDYCEYRFVLMKLQHGRFTEDAGKVLFCFPSPKIQCVFNLAGLKASFNYHQQMNDASIDKQYRCVVTFGSESMVVYEVASISRRYAFDMDIRPQNAVPDSSLQLYIHNLEADRLTPKKTIRGIKFAVGENVSLASKSKEELEKGGTNRVCENHSKKQYDKPTDFINMYILYYFDYEMEPDIYAYFVPLEHIQERSQKLPSDVNRNELIFYSVPVDLEALFQHNCDDVSCKPGFCDSKFILIPLNSRNTNMIWHPVLKKSLYSLIDLKRYYVHYVDERDHCVISGNGEKYIVYAIYSLERYAAIDMNIKPRDIINSEKMLKLCIYSYDTPQTFQKVNETKEHCSGTQSGQESKVASESKEKMTVSNEKSSSETNARKASTASLPNPERTTPDESGNGKKKNERIKSTGDIDGTSRISGLIEGFKGKMGDIRNTVIDTAKDIVDIVTLPNQSNIGYWCHGHWISTNPNSKREQALQVLQEMGFNNRDLNATLLARYGDDLNLALSRLLEYTSDV